MNPTAVSRLSECIINAVEILLKIWKNILRRVLCWLRENPDQAITNCWNLGVSFRENGEKKSNWEEIVRARGRSEKKGEIEWDFFLLSLLFLFLVLIMFFLCCKSDNVTIYALFPQIFSLVLTLKERCSNKLICGSDSLHCFHSPEHCRWNMDEKGWWAWMKNRELIKICKMCKIFKKWKIYRLIKAVNAWVCSAFSNVYIFSLK